MTTFKALRNFGFSRSEVGNSENNTLAELQYQLKAKYHIKKLPCKYPLPIKARDWFRLFECISLKKQGKIGV